MSHSQDPDPSEVYTFRAFVYTWPDASHHPNSSSTASGPVSNEGTKIVVGFSSDMPELVAMKEFVEEVMKKLPDETFTKRLWATDSWEAAQEHVTSRIERAIRHVGEERQVPVKYESAYRWTFPDMGENFEGDDVAGKCVVCKSLRTESSQGLSEAPGTIPLGQGPSVEAEVNWDDDSTVCGSEPE